MNKSYIFIIKLISNIGLLIFLTFQFTGCISNKYYYTKDKVQENIYIEEKIAVKIDVKQSGQSYTNIGLQSLRDDIKDLIHENKLFVDNSNSNKILMIHVENISENSSITLSGAAFTGLTLGSIPNIIDRVVIVNIQLDDQKSTYKGEIIHTQGTGFAGDNYTEDYSINLVKNLVKNALNEFTVKYYKNQHKN